MLPVPADAVDEARIALPGRLGVGLAGPGVGDPPVPLAPEGGGLGPGLGGRPAGQGERVPEVVDRVEAILAALGGSGEGVLDPGIEG
ncbi:hypothetical protein ACRAWG_32565 [Methylobacterium sp. P31]